MLKELDISRIGICCLSEPAEGTYDYDDNANVIFEAVFLQASTYNDSGSASAWIPIRERKSPTPKFDLVGERMIYVEREANSSLIEESLKKSLQERINHILKSF